MKARSRHFSVQPLLQTMLVAILVTFSVSFTPAGESDTPTQVSSQVNAARYPHLNNLQQLSERIYVGGEPHEDVAFSELADLGVRTLVSVDGAKPEVTTAGHHGLRYVHIPIGYDGVSEEAGKSLAQLVRTVEGPIYIHCHHGNHRGPAAAAIACIAEGAVDHEQAREILERSGTSHDYAGLWRDVEKYEPPHEDALLPALVEVAQVDSLTEAMSQIDRATDQLKTCSVAGWQAPAEHPDISPRQEALLVREGLHEAARQLTPEQQADARFVAWFAAAEHSAHELEKALEQNDTSLAAKHMDVLGKTCQQCHKTYRD